MTDGCARFPRFSTRETRLGGSTSYDTRTASKIVGGADETSPGNLDAPCSSVEIG